MNNNNRVYPSFPECLDRYPEELPEIMSPASSSSIAGDHVGLESCLDMVEVEAGGGGGGDEYCCYLSERVRQRREERREMRRREYPPPIPLLARTENLPSHMPWVLRRYHTSDGRLILREEKVRHHEYLRAHRQDGRLTLHLVPMDHNVTTPFDDHGDDEDDDENGVSDEFDDLGSTYDDGGGGGGEDIDGDVVSTLAYCSNGNGHHHVGPSCKCIFGVPISPIRPVHS